LIVPIPFIVETPISKAKRIETCLPNYTPQLVAESVSKACFGIHARDSAFSSNLLYLFFPGFPITQHTPGN
jgi:hypothetical protein